MLKFEYRGLNVMDEIVAVPIGFDENRRTFHIKDASYVVWPDFIGQGSYKHSDGFLKMAKYLKQHYLFQAYAQLDEEAWIEAFLFNFYRDEAVIRFKGNEFHEKIPFNAIKDRDLLDF